MTAPHEPRSTWTVYDHPRDFPNNYVARRWVITDPDEPAQPTPDMLIAPDLEMIRAYLAAHGLVPIPASDDDDPVIVETWI